MVYLFQSNSAGILEVWTLSFKVLVRLVSDDEHDVGGYLVGGLVSFSLEGDLRSRFPARLHIDGENFLLFLGSSVIGEDSP